METKRKAKGSWGLRFFIIVLGITLGILFFWMLNFVEEDIGKIKGLRWKDIRSEFVEASLDQQRKTLDRETEVLERKIQRQTEQQRFLEKSTSGLQNTIKQLLSIQKQSLDKEVSFPEESRKTLEKSQSAFLENQRNYQQNNQDISSLTQQLREKEDKLTAVTKQIQEQEKPARKKYAFKNALFRLGFLLPIFLIPIFLIVSWLFLKYRSSAYWPLVWSSFIVVFIKIAMVAHYYFPKPYFKYIALLVIIGIVLRILIYLIKMIIAPKKDLLIRQYQEHYDKCTCPVCCKPILSGPLRYAGWKKKTSVLAAPGTEIYKQQPYTCPSCGTNLYDKCGNCGDIRHTLLPYCEHCGIEKGE
jgi:hypothetical protein